MGIEPFHEILGKAKEKKAIEDAARAVREDKAAREARLRLERANRTVLLAPVVKREAIVIAAAMRNSGKGKQLRAVNEDTIPPIKVPNIIYPMPGASQSAHGRRKNARTRAKLEAHAQRHEIPVWDLEAGWSEDRGGPDDSYTVRERYLLTTAGEIVTVGGYVALKGALVGRQSVHNFDGYDNLAKLEAVRSGLANLVANNELEVNL